MVVSKKRKRKILKTHKKGVTGLPTEKKKPNFDLSQYTLLIYGREKIGKSTFCSSFPEALFLTTEPGTKGLEIYEHNADDGGCKNWDIIRSAVDLLEKTKRFKTVIIDTVDHAYAMCLDWVCDNRGIEYPGEDVVGNQDYGKSWRAVKKEFAYQVERILRTGRGVVFTSHCKEEVLKEQGKATGFTRIYPSMSSQARQVVQALVDLFFYAEYMKNPQGEVRRVLITEGDDLVWAGAREIGYPLPRFVPLLPKGGYDLLKAAFKGEEVGLDPKTLLPVKTAGATIKRFFNQARLKSVRGRKEVKGKTKMKRRVK